MRIEIEVKIQGILQSQWLRWPNRPLPLLEPHCNTYRLSKLSLAAGFFVRAHSGICRLRKILQSRTSTNSMPLLFQSDIETSSEHPFFVYGFGWASCSPDRSQQLLGLSCRPLQVGDVVVSLTHRQQAPQQPARQPPPPQPQRPAPKAQTARRANKKQQQQQPTTALLPPPTGLPRTLHLPGPASTPTASSTSTSGLDAATASGKKRRWSAPDQLAAAAEEAAAAAAALPSPKLARVPE